MCFAISTYHCCCATTTCSLNSIFRRRVLLTVLEKYSAGTKRSRERPEKLVALAEKYETDLKLMRELYKKADDVEEVAVMKVRTVLDGVGAAWGCLGAGLAFVLSCLVLTCISLASLALSYLVLSCLVSIESLAYCLRLCPEI